MRGAVLLLIAAAASCAAQSLAGFAGTWVQQHQGRNFRVLTLRLQGGVMTGSVVQPRQFTTDPDGDIFNIGAAHKVYAVTKLGPSAGGLEFFFNGDRYSITLTGAGQATLLLLDPDYPFGGAKLERAADPNVTVAASWPVPTYSPEIRELQARLKQMVKVDQAARKTDTISAEKMEVADSAHRAEVLRIHEKYGWPAISLVGKEASHNFWLLVQHQDEYPEVQRKILPDLERAANRGEASKSDFAYLFDRVQMHSGKPQHWGSQVACKDGKPELIPVDDPARLEQRRKELFMIPLAGYLKSMERTCAAMKLP
jgi:hypothetical protein